MRADGPIRLGVYWGNASTTLLVCLLPARTEPIERAAVDLGRQNRVHQRQTHRRLRQPRGISWMGCTGRFLEFVDIP